MSESLITQQPHPLQATSARTRRDQLPDLTVEGPLLPAFSPQDQPQYAEYIRFSDVNKEHTRLRNDAFNKITTRFRDTISVQRVLLYAKRYHNQNAKELLDQTVSSQAAQYMQLSTRDIRSLFGIMEHGLMTYKLLSENDETRSILDPTACEAAFTNLTIAHDLLAAGGLRLAAYFARRFGNAGPYTAADLYQEGSLLFTERMRIFDYTIEGSDFGAYISSVMAFRMKALWQERGQLAGLSRSQVQAWTKVCRAEDEIAAKLAASGELRVPTTAEIAEATGMRKQTVALLRELKTVSAASLDAPFNESEGAANPLELLVDPRANVEGQYEQISRHDMLDNIIDGAHMENAQWFIIGLRYGFHNADVRELVLERDGYTFNYDAIAEEYLQGKHQNGLSIDLISSILHMEREEVRELEQTAIKNLRSQAAWEMAVHGLWQNR